MSVNSFETKTKFVKNQKKEKPCIMSNNELFETWKALNALALTFPQVINGMNMLANINGNTIHQYMLRPCFSPPFEPLLPCDLVHTS